MLNNKDEFIDDILSGLDMTAKTQTPAKANGDDVAAILAELGMAEKPSEKPIAKTPANAAPKFNNEQKTVTAQPSAVKPLPQAAPIDAENAGDSPVDFMRMLEDNKIEKKHYAKQEFEHKPQPKTDFKQDPTVLNYFTVDNPQALGVDEAQAVDLPENYVLDDAQQEDTVFEDLTDNDVAEFYKQDDVYDEFYEKTVEKQPDVQEQPAQPQNDTKEFDLPVDISKVVQEAEKRNTLSNFNLNHGVEKEDFRKFFSTTVSLDEADEKHKQKRPPFAFAQKLMEKAKTQPDDEPIEISDLTDDDEDAIPDYNSHEDAQEILAELKVSRVKMIMRLLFTGLICAISIFIGLFGKIPFFSDLTPISDPIVFIMINFGLLFFAMLVSIRTITNGVMSFFAQKSTDVFPTVAVFAALIQLIVLLFTAGGETAGTQVIILSTIAILGLMFNGIGKWMQMSVVIKNFELTTTRLDYSASYVLENSELAKKVAQGLGEDEPMLMVSRQTGLITGFLKNSFTATDSDHKAVKIVPIIAAFAVVSAAITAFLTKDIAVSVTAFCGMFCVTAPFTSTLVWALPMLLMRGAASKAGAIITGSQAVNQLSSVNVVMATARDIYPSGTVTLAGIKTFEKERIDLAILYAASLLVEGSETLRDIFLSVIEGNLQMLYPVENLTKETGYGYVGWIDNNRVIVGNREMMKRHDVEVPSLDYEYRFTKGEKQPIYLAVSGKLFGMFLVKYHPHAEVGGTLEDLQASGVSLLIQSDDFNITAQMVEEMFMLKPNTVKIMTQADEEILSPHLAYLPKSEGVMSHIGTFASYLGGLYAATSAKAAEKSAWLVQTFGMGFGVLVMLVLTFTQGIAALTLTAVILFLLAWLVLTVAAPLLKKY